MSTFELIAICHAGLVFTYVLHLSTYRGPLEHFPAWAMGIEKPRSAKGQSRA